MSSKVPRAYLAGPTMFFADAEVRYGAQEAAAKNWGLVGVRPAEGEMPLGLRGVPLAQAIFGANIARIRDCDIVIADLSPFRGPSADIGTAWECAYAFALGKLVVGWTSEPRPYAARVKDDGATVEDFGLFDNLMLACAMPEPPAPNFELAAQAAIRLWRGR